MILSSTHLLRCIRQQSSSSPMCCTAILLRLLIISTCFLGTWNGDSFKCLECAAPHDSMMTVSILHFDFDLEFSGHVYSVCTSPPCSKNLGWWNARVSGGISCDKRKEKLEVATFPTWPVHWDCFPVYMIYSLILGIKWWRFRDRIVVNIHQHLK